MNPIAPRILFEDNHLIILNKLPSELVQGDKTGDKSLLETVRDYIRSTYDKQGNVFTGLVHRIDRPVSGAVVFAKTGKALARMNELVKVRDFDKTYLAIVKQKPPKTSDELTHFLIKNEKQNKSYVGLSTANNAKKAQLAYKLIAQSDRFFLLEVKLLTGRHHQIRAQLSAIGCPIRGDLKYGSDRPNPDGSISLHARRLVFTHPVKKAIMDILAPLPAEMPWNLFTGILDKNQLV